MKIIDRGICAGGGEKPSSAAFPGVCVLPREGGQERWLVGYRAAPTKASVGGQRALLTHSDDNGATWREPFEPLPPPSDGDGPGTFRSCYPTALGGPDVLASLGWVDASDPSLPFFNEATQGLLRTRIFHSRSRDWGETWSTPQPMDTNPITVETPLTGPALVLPDGGWGCQFELNKSYRDTSVWRHSSIVMISMDRGASWPLVSVASNDPTNRVFTWDQRPGVLQDGRVLNLFWTYDNTLGEYLNIHARDSRDSARTWSSLWDTGVPGQPAAPVSLPSGRVAMVYVDRTHAPAIKIRTSGDGGHTWPPETELTLHASASSQTVRKKVMEDAWAEMGDFSIGLPATTPLPDGDVLIVYYAGEDTDHTAIHWVRVRET